MRKQSRLLLMVTTPLLLCYMSGCKSRLAQEQQFAQDNPSNGASTDVPLQTDTLAKVDKIATTDSGPLTDRRILGDLPNPGAPVIEVPGRKIAIRGANNGIVGGGGGSQGALKPARTNNEDDDNKHICGNGILEGREECDDGNAVDDDLCNNRCEIVPESCSAHFFNGRTYIFCNDAKSWAAAEATCNGFGPFDLTSIGSSTENTFVRDLFNGYNDDDDDDDDDGNSAWIGFNDIASEGNFVWANGEPVTYTNWNSGEPNDSGDNEDCTELLPSYTWNDLTCQDSRVYVCESLTSH